jgi:mycothiol system anti-sigma-R factor
MATDCKGTLEELERFLDQELPEGKFAEVMGHLRTCPDCQGAFDFHGELKRVVRTKASSEEMPAGLMAKIEGCFGDDWLA